MFHYQRVPYYERPYQRIDVITIFQVGDVCDNGDLRRVDGGKYADQRLTHPYMKWGFLEKIGLVSMAICLCLCIYCFMRFGWGSDTLASAGGSACIAISPLIRLQRVNRVLIDW